MTRHNHTTEELTANRLADTKFDGKLSYFESRFDDEYHIDIKCNEATYMILSGILKEQLDDGMFANVLYLPKDGDRLRVTHVPKIYLRYVIEIMKKSVRCIDKTRVEAETSGGELYSNDPDQLLFRAAIDAIDEANGGAVTVLAD